jgi:hypothetical protein
MLLAGGQLTITPGWENCINYNFYHICGEIRIKKHSGADAKDAGWEDDRLQAEPREVEDPKNKEFKTDPDEAFALLLLFLQLYLLTIFHLI